MECEDVLDKKLRSLTEMKSHDMNRDGLFRLLSDSDRYLVRSLWFGGSADLLLDLVISTHDRTVNTRRLIGHHDERWWWDGMKT